MGGFNTVGEITDADLAGRCWVTQFRKAVASAATNTNGGIDYTYFAGSPPANFYASSPLVSSLVESVRGIYVPTVGDGKKQFLNNVKIMSSASSATSATNGRQLLMLADYLLYYPFVDTDAVGEEQTLENTVTLPRYAAGEVIAVSQSASSALGQFTITYTNEKGVPGRVSQNNFTTIVAGGGQVVNAFGPAGASYNSFINLQAGDEGVSSIQSCTMTAAGGGLMALVIVKPIMLMYFNQESRRTTTGNLESYGACDEFQSVIHKAGLPEIKDGAVLGFFASGFAGSLASSILVGTLETVWQ